MVTKCSEISHQILLRSKQQWLLSQEIILAFTFGCSWGKLFIFNVCFNSNKLCNHHLWKSSYLYSLRFSCSLIQDDSFFEPLMSLLVLPTWSCNSSLNVSTKSGVFHILFHYILFFTNHSYFDLESACGIYDENMEKSLMPILLL